MTPIPDQKAALRSQAKAVRKRLAEAAPPDLAQGAARALFSQVPLASDRTISAYWPVRSEFDPRPIMAEAVDRGLAVALPVVAGPDRPLFFRRWLPGMALEPAAMDIPVPPATAEELQPDILIVPLLAFDKQGFRLGYGGGFYDRTIARLRGPGQGAAAIGLGFAGQEVATVPHDDNDQPMDWLLTESFAREIR